ncbi:hypothetical protein OF83DRAFT_1175975 [Amylostereum chailletii]|nr:hypothetical protein OF83DRAFT_1175975 [Amylostereum chailletii]
MEDELKHNLEGYYVHGLKSIGYVQLITLPTPAARSAPSLRREKPTRQKPPSPSWASLAVSGGLALLVLGAALSVPLLYSSSPGASAAK